jgi:hypothetical protein
VQGVGAHAVDHVLAVFWLNITVEHQQVRCSFIAFGRYYERATFMCRCFGAGCCCEVLLLLCVLHSSLQQLVSRLVRRVWGTQQVAGAGACHEHQWCDHPGDQALSHLAPVPGVAFYVLHVKPGVAHHG